VESGERIEEALAIFGYRRHDSAPLYADTQYRKRREFDIEERKEGGIGSKARLQSLHFFFLSRC
jgi:hypothetical protein